MPSEVFFGRNDDFDLDEKSKHRPLMTQKAMAETKSICAQCPVKMECLEFAVTTGQDFGVWGGLTPPERRKFKRPTAALTSRQ